MFDYGLFALIVVILVLVFLAFHAWRSIRAEADRISAQWTKIEARIAECEHTAGAAKAVAGTAEALAKEVQTTHYKSLLHRLNEAENTAQGAVKQCEVLAEKIASMGGRISGMARWMKKDAEPAPMPAAGEDAETIPMFPAAPVPPAGNIPVTGHFGRMARKVG